MRTRSRRGDVVADRDQPGAGVAEGSRRDRRGARENERPAVRRGRDPVGGSPAGACPPALGLLGCGHAAAQRPATPDQPRHGRHRDHHARERGRDRGDAGLRAGYRGIGAEPAEDGDDPGAEQQAAQCEQARGEGEQAEDHQDSGEQHPLVVRAELADRELLERGRGEVDRTRSHGVHRGRLRPRRDGDQLADRERDARADQPEEGAVRTGDRRPSPPWQGLVRCGPLRSLHAPSSAAAPPRTGRHSGSGPRRRGESAAAGRRAGTVDDPRPAPGVWFMRPVRPPGPNGWPAARVVTRTGDSVWGRPVRWLRCQSASRLGANTCHDTARESSPPLCRAFRPTAR